MLRRKRRKAGAGVTVSNLTVVSPTQVTATFAIDAGAATGARNVTITTPSGTSGAVTFTIVVPAPTFSGIKPNSGAQGASAPVTLTGTNLTGATAVAVAGSGVTVSNLVVVSATQVTTTFAVDAGAVTGARDVAIITSGGTSGAATFTIVLPAPMLTGINPNSGAQGASVPVTLTGTNLTGATALAVAGSGVTVSNLVVGSSTQVTATCAIDAGAATGARDVTITAPGGTSGATTIAVAGSGVRCRI